MSLPCKDSYGNKEKGHLLKSYPLDWSFPSAGIYIRNRRFLDFVMKLIGGPRGRAVKSAVS